MIDFKDWLESNSEVFPVPKSEFIDKLLEFGESSEGYIYFIESKIGYFDGKLRFVSI